MARVIRTTGSLLIILLLLTPTANAINLYTYTNAGTSGDWNDPGTWTTDPTGATLIGNSVPGNNDVVTILNGFTVYLTSNVTATGLSIVINNGATLDLVIFTVPTISSLAGSGTLAIRAGYFPTITTNAFQTSYAAGATVLYYDFNGNVPSSVSYPNLSFLNSTGVDHEIALSNTSGGTINVLGNLTTSTTGSGDLAVVIGTQAGNALTLKVTGNIAIGANTTFGVGLFSSIHTVNVEGNFTNNGTVQFSNSVQYTTSANGAAHLTFSGEADRTFACQGITNLYTLTLDKGSGSTSILSVTSTDVANFNFYHSGQLLILQRGTLKLGENIDIPRVYGASTANYDLGSSSLSPMLWIDGATFSTNGSAFVTYGKFRLTSGTFSSMGGQGTVIREEGQYLIEGGTFNTEKFRPSSTSTGHRGTFIMTGGVLNAQGTTGSDGNYARFSLPYPEQVFIMSGGTINIRNSQTATGALHIGSNAASNNVTGGTINVILSGTSASFPVISTAALWNLRISRVAGATAATVPLASIGALVGAENDAQPLVIKNDFILEGDNAPTFNANNLNVTVGGNFIIEAGAAYNPGTNTTILNGSGDQTFNVSGTITSGLNNLRIDKSAGTLTVAGSVTNVIVRGTLTMLNGIINDGGKTIEARGAVRNDAVHTGTGNITLNGTAMQTVSGDGTGVFGNLTLDNNSVPGATVTSDVTISGTLTLAGSGTGLLDIGPYQLWLSSPSATALSATGAPFSSTKMVRTLGLQSDRGIRKSFGNLLPFTFHFGSGSDYTPATIQLTSAPAAYGSLSVKPVDSRHPFVAVGNTNNLEYYWKILSEGFSGVVSGSVSHQFNYLSSKVAPSGDDATYVPARYSSNGWTTINDVNQVTEGSQLVMFSSVDYLDGDFTAGRPAAYAGVKIFYSIRSGIWSDTDPATTPWSNDSHTGAPASTEPGPGDQVFIGDGAANNHNIVVQSNGLVTGSVAIAPGSTLDVGTTTGHNFGRLEVVSPSGSGLLRISSATPVAEFPAGDFGLFIREVAGGTVEYYTTGSQDFAIPASSLTPTNLPLISYRYLLLTPEAGSTITMPAQNMTIFANMTVQGADNTAKVNLNSTGARTLSVNGNLQISSGNLQFQNDAAQSITVGGNVTVESGGVFNVATTGTIVANGMTIGGNLVNSGVVNLSQSNRYCNVTFTGTSNATISGAGSTTDLHVLRVSKGTNQSSILNVTATNFRLLGGGLPLDLISGTFRLSSNVAITVASGSIFNIPAAARLSANGGVLQVMGSNGRDMRIAGTLEILAGTVNVGTSSATDNSIEYAATGSPTITISGNGRLNVNGQIRRSTASSQGKLTYSQSGTSIVTVGRTAVTAPSRGVFEILNPGSSFTMAGGTLRIERHTTGSVAELYLQPESSNVTAGTIEIGQATSAMIVDINTTIPLFNLVVSGSDNGARLDTNPLTLRGSLTINSDNYFSASGLSVSIAGNLTNSNPSSSSALNAGGYRPATTSQTTTFNSSSGNQNITGASSNLTVFSNLVINNTLAGGAVRLQSNTAVRVNSTLTITRGTLAGNANVITAMGNVNNSATHTSTGSGNLTLAGATSQLIGGNGSGKFGNVVLNNSSGATLTANQEIAGVLALTSGSLFINQFGLYLSNTSPLAIEGADATRYIVTSGQLSNGGLRKAFSNNVSDQNFVYPVGVAGKYTPADYTISTGSLGGTITVKPVNSKHPGATGSGTSYLDYYWNVSNAVIILTSLTHKYQYVASDEEGDPVDYHDAYFRGGAWNIGITAGNPDPATRIITFTNTDLAGDYTAGEPTAFVNPTTYVSISSGDWESDDSVWDQDPPGTNLGPPAGSFVIISEGHTITINTNTKRPATLDVRGRLHIGNSTGHDFGVVSASGIAERTIQIQSSTFPSGDFSNFVDENGGTVEYFGSLTLPTQSVYNNLVLTGPGVKTLPNADLTLNGSLSILSGTVNNTVYNRNILLTSATGDFTNFSAFNAGAGSIIIQRHLINSGSSTTFSAPSGSGAGISVGGNLTNSGGAGFVGGTDAITVDGNVSNSSNFQVGSGSFEVVGNITNTGTFTTGAGAITIGGSLTNNNTYTAGTGATTVTANFSNSGATAVYTANNNQLSLGGDFSNVSDANFNANTGSILLDGAWTNTATFNAGSGSVSFRSGGAQSLTGATDFFNLIRTNGGVLTLNSSISVSGTLTLSGGPITTASNQITLTNTAVQPVTGQNATNFIDGRLAISYPNTAGVGRIFPVGRGNIYRPVTIHQTSTSSSPVVRVEVINSAPVGTYPNTIQGLSEARYYSVDVQSGTINDPVIELSFNTNSPFDENIVIPGNTRIVRAASASGPWTDEGGSGVFSPAAPSGYATSDVTTITNPTFFALGYQNVAMPVTMGPLEAAMKDGVVWLNWTTFTEKNNAYFTIERSSSGLVYDSIGYVSGAGDSNLPIRYFALDENPLAGISYYRLKQTDYDGTSDHSNVVKVENKNGPYVSLYPNPAYQSDEVLLKIFNPNESTGFLVISSATGVIQFQGVVRMGEPIKLSGLVGSLPSKGVYILKITSKGMQEIVKLLVR